MISYEGVVIAPLNIRKQTYNEKQAHYTYEAQLEFSPIAFPDKWETLNLKHRVKKIVCDFFDLLKW